MMEEEPKEEEQPTEEEPVKEEPAETTAPEEATDQEMEAPEEATEPEEAPEEEAKPRRRRKKEEEEEEIVEERFYTIPLSKVWIRPPKKRAPRAMHMIREFITKHMKLEMRVEEEEEKEELPKLVLSQEVNEKVWSRGIEKPPRKIRVRAAKDKDGNVTVYLAEGE
jgi:large subunit ribosomal protein L31e